MSRQILKDRRFVQAVRTISPLVLYSAIVIALYLDDVHTVWEPLLLLPTMNMVLFIAAVAAAILSGFAFLHGGGAVLLTLGVGVFVFGLGNAVAPLLLMTQYPNVGITVHNTSALLSGALLLFSVVGSNQQLTMSNSRGVALVRSYAGAVIILAGIAVLAFAGLWPTYLTPEGSFTPFRSLALWSAILLYGMAAVAAAVLARITARRFLRWYAMGLAFVALGLMAVSLGPVGSGIGWSGRIAQLTGQLYIVACLLAALKERRPIAAPVGAALADGFEEVQEALGRSHAQLQTALESMTDAVFITDASGQFTQFNEAFVHFHRFPTRQAASLSLQEHAQTVELRFLDGSPVPLRHWPVQRALQGEIATNQEYLLRRTDTGETWIGSYSLSPIRDKRGLLVGAVIVCRDVTELKRAQDAERARMRVNDALARIERTIHGTLQRDEMLSRVAEESAMAIGADGTVLAMHEDDMWVVRYAYNMREEIIGHAFTNEQAPFVRMAAESGEPIALSDAYNDPRAVRESQEAFGVRAVLMAPLMVRGEAIGGLFFNYWDVQDFSAEDMFYASRLATSVGLALANIELYESEHDIAETLQETLVVLPSRVQGIKFARSYKSATYEAGHVGGDFVDVFEVRPDTVGICLGDVSGKGIDAAVTTSLVRTTVRVHALDGHSAEIVVEKTNDIVHRFIEADSFVTLWFALLNTKTGCLRYVSAGHPPALVVDAEASVRELEGGNPFIGAFTGIRYAENITALQRGDRLVLYSDGIIEARSPTGVLFGESRLHDLVSVQRDVDVLKASDAVMRAILEFSEGVLRDDAAILVVEPSKLCDTPADNRQMQAFFPT